MKQSDNGDNEYKPPEGALQPDEIKNNNVVEDTPEKQKPHLKRRNGISLSEEEHLNLLHQIGLGTSSFTKGK